MNLSENEGRGLKPKDYLIVLVIGFILIATSTVSSQTLPIPRNDSTSIAYFRLNELAKFVEYKKVADSIISRYEVEVRLLDSVSSIRAQRLHNFEFEVLPPLHNQLNLAKQETEKVKQLGSLREEVLNASVKREKGKKWSWGATGLSLGAILGILAALFIG